MSNLSDFMPKAYPGLSIASVTTLKWVQTRPVLSLEATDTSAGAEVYPKHVFKTARNVANAGGAQVFQAQNDTPAYISHVTVAGLLNTLTTGAESSEYDVTVYAAGTQKVVSVRGDLSAVVPGTSGDFSLGTMALRWNGLYVGDDSSVVAGDFAPASSTLQAGAHSNHPFNFITNNTVRGGFDALGNFALKKALADQSASLQVPVNSFSITIGAGVSSLLLNPAGTLATGTITMPAAPVDGQLVRLSTTQTITTLTLSPNSGQTISGAAATLTAAAPASYQYNASSAIWFHVT